MKLIQAVEQEPAGPRGAGTVINNPVATAAIWLFFRQNPDRVLLKIGGFIKIRVKDLRILFELIAGPEPL
jgi:hypothetical protein